MWLIICDSVILQITEKASSERLPTGQLVHALGSSVGRREKVQGVTVSLATGKFRHVVLETTGRVVNPGTKCFVNSSFQKLAQ